MPQRTRGSRSTSGRHRKPPTKHSATPVAAASVAITAAAVGGLNLPQAVGEETPHRAAARTEVATLPRPADTAGPAGTAALQRLDADRQVERSSRAAGRRSLRLHALELAAQQSAVRHAAELEAARYAAIARSTRAAARRATTLAAQDRAAKASAAQARAASPDWALPVSGYRLSAGFGQSSHLWSHRHTGQDFAASFGTQVRSVGDGVVVSASYEGAYGNQLVLRHGDGTLTWYCHLSAFLVGVGQRVQAGEPVGRIGLTGNTTGPHLHFEVHPHGGGPVDPMPWLREHGLRP